MAFMGSSLRLAAFLLVSTSACQLNGFCGLLPAGETTDLDFASRSGDAPVFGRWHYFYGEKKEGDQVLSLRNSALAGMIGPAVFAFIVVVLTLAQYGFIVRLGWDPVGSSDVPWPSGLALGPLGWLQVLNFVFFGLTLIAFALGLHRGVLSLGRGSGIGAALLVVASVALVLSGFKTDPHLSEGPQTWHGLIHGLAFIFLLLSLLLSLFFWWWRLRRGPHWRGYELYTLMTAILYVALLFVSPWQWGFYLFLAVILAWIEVMALRLYTLAENASARRHPRVR
jgi:Protein of unknown function (DUF998)